MVGYITRKQFGMETKRKSYRRKLRIKGKYGYLGEEAIVYNCYINNISKGGIHLTGDQSFMIGERIWLKFPLNNKTILAHLDIVHVSGRNAGTKFVMIHKDMEDHIKENLLGELG